MLINSLLSSSEVLYGIKLKHIELLESCDRNLLTRLFSVPSSCSYEAVFLETGCLPIRFIIKGRRLLYYWTLLNKPDEELVKRFFNVQKQFSDRDDWIRQVEDDKQSLDIVLSEEEIRLMKKDSFKKILKAKLCEKARDFLYKLKEGHSKTSNLGNFSLQEYLKSENLSTNEKKLLFSLRTRSYDVKSNYKNKFKFNMQCRYCENESEVESEVHLINCSKISENIDPDVDLADACYDNIFSEEIEDQVSITKVFNNIQRTRNILMRQ